ncbi:MAG: T9SS type A sorting domain-containing protein [Saprospiraceae bacterium]
MNKSFCLLVLFLFSVKIAIAQDTLVVPSFNFKSSTKKDTMVNFPTEDHANFEKILMQYTMRCKNAAVSTSSNRNLGCGEWDYSCNTLVTDSTRVDSTRATAPNYIISGYKEDFFPYVTRPTFTYTSFTLKEIDIITANNEKIKVIGSGNAATKHPFVAGTKSAKSYYLIKAAELGNTLGNTLNGLEFEMDGKLADVNFLKVKIKETKANELSAAGLETTNFRELFFNDTNLGNPKWKRLHFYEPFVWDGVSNLLVEITYNNPQPLPATLYSEGESTAFACAAYTPEDDAYIVANGDTRLELPVDKMSSVSTEITIGFWSNGNASNLPANTSIFEAVDAKNIRQLNVHLPWSDSNIYWDCGGDNGGTDRINKVATAADFAGKWNYWTFTKNTVAKTMKIYLNGVLWHSGTSKSKVVDIKKFVLGTSMNNNNRYFGQFDDFSVWNKELDLPTIQQIMRQKMEPSHPNFSNLVCYYNFNETTVQKEANDLSVNKSVANFVDLPNKSIFQGRLLEKGFVFESQRPNIKFYSGKYTISVGNRVAIDSVQNSPNKVRSFFVENNRLKEGTTYNYWLAGDFDILDEYGKVVGTKTVVPENELSISSLVYFNYSPAKFELLSFVTPYGIGLDFGKEGKTWVFDVTDLGPVLKGKKRMTIERGGQNQEELDIKFLYIRGKAPRDVKNVQQIWPVNSIPFANLLNNNAFEPRALQIAGDVKAAKIKSAITGHGQEGEFIPQIHFLNINGGARELEWQVWKECSNNPVYPQGGTWIYDRAGWCPGAPTDIRELDISNIISAQKDITVDYGVVTASGDSRYIISNQLVTYGSPNFKTDAAITRVIKPTVEIENGRFNPVCMNPEIEIRNTGEEALTSLLITYGVKGGSAKNYNWTGNLGFLQTARVILPTFDLSDWPKSNLFQVSISMPNGKTDEYDNNNSIESRFNQVAKWNSSVIIQMRTNNAPTETSWELTDMDGKVLKSRKNGLVANRSYNDTLHNLNGCYQLRVLDNGDDGISFWNNGDGAGSIGIRNLGGVLSTFNPDFGREIRYQFMAGNTIAATDIQYTPELTVYPNPTAGSFTLQIEGFSEEGLIVVTDVQGKEVYRNILNNVGEIRREIPIDLGAAAAGMYFVQVRSQKMICTAKLIKW